MSALEIFSSYVGPSKSDIFSSVHRVPCGQTNAFFHTCIPNEVNQDLPSPVQLLKCGGAGLSEAQSQTSAIGEGLERFAAVKFSLEAPNYFADAIQLNDNNRRHFPPERWLAFEDAQYADKDFPLTQFTQRSKLKWYEAENLQNGEKVLLPGPVGVFAYRRTSNEDRISPTTSTGLALGLSKHQAQVAGLLEVIERDAFTLAWTFCRPAKMVSFSGAELREMKAQFGLSNDVTINAFEVSPFDNISSFIATLEVEIDGHPFICVGSAARCDAREALDKALLEAVQGIPYVQFLKNKFGASLPNRFEEVTSFEKSAVFYSLHPETLKEARAFVDGELFAVSGEISCPTPTERKIHDFESDLSRLVRALSSNDHDAFWLDCTAPEFTGTDIVVGRAVVPSLYSLEGDFRLRNKNRSRADVVSALEGGWQVKVRPQPHPLP